MKLSFTDKGDGFPVVLLHAYPLSKGMWNEQIEFLADKNFRVIAPDLRGFGESISSDLTLSIIDMAKDVAELLDELNIEKAIIGGLSMGGYVTFNLYDIHPELFAGMILCDTSSSADDADKKDTREKMIGGIEKEGMQFLVDNMLPSLVSEESSEKKELIESIKAEFMKCSPESATAAMRGMAERKDQNDLLSKIDVPTLLIFGEEDKPTNVENAERMAEQIQDSTLKTIANAGHYSNLEKPEEFNNHLYSFLRQF